MQAVPKTLRDHAGTRATKSAATLGRALAAARRQQAGGGGARHRPPSAGRAASTGAWALVRTSRLAQRHLRIRLQSPPSHHASSRRLCELPGTCFRPRGVDLTRVEVHGAGGPPFGPMGRFGGMPMGPGPGPGSGPFGRGPPPGWGGRGPGWGGRGPGGPMGGPPFGHWDGPPGPGMHRPGSPGFGGPGRGFGGGTPCESRCSHCEASVNSCACACWLICTACIQSASSLLAC